MDKEDAKKIFEKAKSELTEEEFKQIDQASSLLCTMTMPLSMAYQRFYKADPKHANMLFASVLSLILSAVHKDIDSAIASVREIQKIAEKNLIDLDHDINKD
jgi:hypothetical protein